MGSPGMDIGAPGRPGLASSTWSWITTVWAGSGVSNDGDEATTVMACRTEANCWNCKSTAFCWPAAKETSTTTETKSFDSPRSWYSPASILSRVNLPLVSLVVSCTKLPAELMSFRWAPATATLWGSRIFPEIRPESGAADKFKEPAKKKNSTERARYPNDLQEA